VCVCVCVYVCDKCQAIEEEKRQRNPPPFCIPESDYFLT